MYKLSENIENVLNTNKTIIDVKKEHKFIIYSNFHFIENTFNYRNIDSILL